MMVFKRKQVVVLSLVVMIVLAGYLQYTYNKNSTAGKDPGKNGEAVYVGNDNEGSTNANSSTNTVGNKDNNEANASVPASKATNDYFAQAKLDREITRDKNADALTEITQDANAENNIKTEAYNVMIQMTQNAEKEMKVENKVKDLGFSDVFALVGDDGSISITVKTPNLTSAQVASIADIAQKQANIDIGSISIKNKY